MQHIFSQLNEAANATRQRNAANPENSMSQKNILIVSDFDLDVCLFL